jgi:hypothetical protein
LLLLLLSISLQALLLELLVPLTSLPLLIARRPLVIIGPLTATLLLTIIVGPLTSLLFY